MSHPACYLSWVPRVMTDNTQSGYLGFRVPGVWKASSPPSLRDALTLLPAHGAGKGESGPFKIH